MVGWIVYGVESVREESVCWRRMNGVKSVWGRACMWMKSME